jgi:ribonuclease Y
MTCSRRPWRPCSSSPPTRSPRRGRARGESLENYIRGSRRSRRSRREDGRREGVRAPGGREIRVIVEPTEVDDDGAVLLSHEIAARSRISSSIPGQVKVIVIRESRAIEVAK